MSAGVYAVAAALLVIPVVDVLSQVWPPRPSLAEWRYGTLGLMSNYFLTPLLGLVLAGAAAFLVGSRRAQRIMALIALVGAAAMLIAVAAFSLDVLQVRQSVVAEAMPMFKIGALKAAGKLVVYFACLAILGIGYWKASAPPPNAPAAPPDMEWRLGGKTE